MKIKFLAFGGYQDCERKMISVFPDYVSEDEVIFPISAVGITYNSKFSTELTHRDFMGSILGLGIERISWAISLLLTME